MEACPSCHSALRSTAHYLTPAPNTHRRTQFDSAIHYSGPQRAIELHRTPLGYNGHNSAPTPVTRIQPPPIASNACLSPPKSATCFQCLPLASDALRLPLAPTICLNPPPHTHDVAMAHTTCLWRRPFASATHHLPPSPPCISATHHLPPSPPFISATHHLPGTPALGPPQRLIVAMVLTAAAAMPSGCQENTSASL